MKKGGKSARNYHAEIDKELRRMESMKRPEKGLSWCSNRIDWCWKYRHITEQQMSELCDRVIELIPIYGE